MTVAQQMADRISAALRERSPTAQERIPRLPTTSSTATARPSIQVIKSGSIVKGDGVASRTRSKGGAR